MPATPTPPSSHAPHSKWKWVIVLVIAGVVTVILGYGRGGQEIDAETPYIYADTRQLVRFVEDAAELVEQRGVDAFTDFSAPDSRWAGAGYYLFVYRVDGTCVYHPITPELVGKNLLNFRDMNGRPMIERIVSFGRRSEPHASGWEFYLWQERTELSPTWKSSYVRKAVAPDGAVYVVGSGIHNPKIEPVFIRNKVDQAVELLKTAGKDRAFARFLDSTSPYYFFDTYVFVLDEKGCCLVDPAFPNLTHRDMMEFRDAVGRSVIAESLRKLQKADAAWGQYLMPKPGAVVPSRKLMYLRKVNVKGETLIVGATAYMATPIWMRL